MLPPRSPHVRREIDRRVVRLAWPALVTLAAEPLLLLTDAAIVGRLGTTELAGLGVASVVLQTVVGLCVFLAYATTASVARRAGAGQAAAALTQGVEGLWLAAMLGLGLTAGGLAVTGPTVRAFGVAPGVAEAATTYLEVAWFGTLPMLVVLAASGVLRGLHDTRTPLYAVLAATLVNVALTLTFVYGFGLGIAGAALGTVLAQLGAALALAGVVVRRARRHRAALRPSLPGLRRSLSAGGPLLVRTLSLRASLLVMTWSAAGLGVTATATHQVAMTVWTFLAYVLDALAIAAQALTGTALGSGDADLARRTAGRVLRLGLYAGALTAVGLGLTAPFLGTVFSDDRAVVALLGEVLLVAAVAQPVAAVVFVLDGVLIGAGDGRFLALASAVVLAVFAPLAVLATRWGDGSLLALWAAFGVGFIGVRAALLLHRVRGSRWLTIEAP